MVTAALAAAVAGFASAPLVLSMLRRASVLDVPNERSSHATPTLRGGGWICVVGCVVGGAVARGTDDLRLAILIVSFAFAAIGAVDDRRGIAAKVRLAAQFVAAGIGVALVLSTPTGNPAWCAAFVVGCVVWIVAYVNAFNFMDGVNGISVAQVVVAGIAWFIAGQREDLTTFASLALVSSGAALAFLPFNFPRARVFLGDVGSYLFGAWMATLVIYAMQAGINPEAVIAPVSLYLVDTALTIVRRIRRGETWYLPHRSHIYQQLHQAGLGHPATTGIVAMFIAALSTLGLQTMSATALERTTLVAVAALVLGGYVATPSVARRLVTAT